MYLILPLSMLIKLAGMLSTATLLIVFTVYSLDINDFSDWLRAISYSLSIASILVLLIGGTRVWRYIWEKFPSLNKKIYPDLNGLWQGEIESNWPIIQAKTTGSKLHDCNQESGRKKVTLKIHASWFNMKMFLKTTDQYSESETIFSLIPIHGSDGSEHQLQYIYRNVTDKPLDSDSGNHEGAALLKIRNELSDEPRLEGVYWTNRNWTKGLNTAGKINLTRISKDPEDNGI